MLPIHREFRSYRIGNICVYLIGWIFRIKRCIVIAMYNQSFFWITMAFLLSALLYKGMEVEISLNTESTCFVECITERTGPHKNTFWPLLVCMTCISFFVYESMYFDFLIIFMLNTMHFHRSLSANKVFHSHTNNYRFSANDLVNQANHLKEKWPKLSAIQSYSHRSYFRPHFHDQNIYSKYHIHSYRIKFFFSISFILCVYFSSTINLS